MNRVGKARRAASQEKRLQVGAPDFVEARRRNREFLGVSLSCNAVRETVKLTKAVVRAKETGGLAGASYVFR